MSIIWKYLDKRSAAVDALKDYGSMKFIIEHTDDEIKAAYEKMGGAQVTQYRNRRRKSIGINGEIWG